MSFFGGFLKQWNIEDELDIERSKVALSEDKLRADRQVALMGLAGGSTGSRSTAASNAKDEAHRNNIAWVKNQGGLSEEEVKALASNPTALAKARKGWEDYLGRKGGAVPKGAFGELFKITVDNPSLVDNREDYDAFMEEVQNPDLDSDMYVDLYSRGLGLRQPTGQGVSVEGDPSVYHERKPSDFKLQTDWVASEIELRTDGVRDYLLQRTPTGEIDEVIAGLEGNYTVAAAITEWETLLKRYKTGDKEAGTIIFNTLGLQNELDQNNSIAIMGWEENPSLSHYATVDRNYSFNNYLEDKYRAGEENKRVGG